MKMNKHNSLKVQIRMKKTRDASDLAWIAFVIVFQLDWSRWEYFQPIKRCFSLIIAPFVAVSLCIFYLYIWLFLLLVILDRSSRSSIPMSLSNPTLLLPTTLLRLSLQWTDILISISLIQIYLQRSLTERRKRLMNFVNL